MQEAVDKEEIKLIIQGQAAGRAVTGGSFYRNHHIAEQVGIKTAKISFQLGKSDHVGGIISVEILPVDLPDLIVINQHQADFLVAATEFPNDFIRCQSQPASVYLYFFLPVFDQ